MPPIDPRVEPDDAPKKTPDKLDAIQAMLESAGLKQDRILEQNELTKVRLERLETVNEGMRHQVHRLSVRLSSVEEDIKNLRDKDSEIQRQTSSADLDHAAAIGGTIAHVSTLETSIREIDSRTIENARVQAAICRELGLDHDGIASGSVRPPAPGERPERGPKKTTLARISNENRIAALGGGFTLLLIVLRIVAHLLGIPIPQIDL